MPYTPPSHRSPATSKTNSPVLSRSHSYNNESTGNSPSAAHRSMLPRSLSSAAYLNKHRRTPSISDHQTSQDGAKASTSSSEGPHTNGSLRQSPSPVSNLLIPPGAITTPPDSAQSSDDEERGRRRGLVNLAELQQALQSIELKRGGSPSRADDDARSKSTPNLSTGPASSALTPEARKISHSRSTSELTLSIQNTNMMESPSPTSEDSDVEDDELRIKPSLVRKKSGELVKPALRPSSRRRPSSMPGTPTFSKAVHFNEDIEQVRHFLQVDRPIAVSAGSSPVETYESETEYPFGYDDGHRSNVVEWEIKLTNFPEDSLERKSMPVRVERIFLSVDNTTLIGTIAVANLGFHKTVVARFTLDYWKTTSEVAAEYNNDVRQNQINDGFDRFNFNIKLADQANLETKTLLLCARYNVNGQEFWDNNNWMNYQVDFIKKVKPRNPKGGKQGTSAGGLGAIPRSKNSPSGRPRTSPASFDDDFAGNSDSKYKFGSAVPALGDSPIRLRNKPRKGSTYPVDQSRKSSGNPAFSTRYDFGASLSAALSNAQSVLGERSGLKQQDAAKPKSSDSSVKTTKPSTSLDGPRPDALSSEKPDLRSAEYNELIQRYCFFGSGKSSPQLGPPHHASSTEGTRDGQPSENSSASVPHAGPKSSSHKSQAPSSLDGANDHKPSSSSSSSSPFQSRSASPGPVTGPGIGSRSSTPVSFGYPYHQQMHGGIFPESHTPTAILG